MSHSETKDNEHPLDTRPFLCMPYWLTSSGPAGRWDNGEVRPLSLNPVAVSYMCDAIHAGPYTPGKPIDVTVDVLNSGGGNAAAIVIVSVYWAEPTAGFATLNPLGSTSVVVMPSPSSPNIVTSAVVSGTIPEDAPAHVCLVVSVWHPLDKPSTVCDPVGDRHWAQRNLQAVAAVGAGPTMMHFSVGNPFETSKTFDLVIRKVDMQQARMVAGAFDAVPSEMSVRLRLFSQKGEALSRPGRQTQTRIELEAREGRSMTIEIEIDSDLRPGQGIALEALLLDSSRRQRPVGSLGMVVLSSR